MTVIGASLLMGLAVWIAMPSATRKQEGRHLPAWSGIPVGFVVAWLLFFGASGVVWAVMTVVVGETVLVVVRRQRRRAQILKGGREVARATRALAGRVSVGEIPSVALEHVADDVEVLAQARRAQAVAEAFPTPHCHLPATRMAGLVPLAHAWHLAATTGAPLAPAAKSVAEGTARRAA
ncbi:transmembrane protein [Cutibacterium acnes JCM 18918]|nr:transmembrane protein [Cutibacterium acnes JCM 18918]